MYIYIYIYIYTNIYKPEIWIYGVFPSRNISEQHFKIVRIHLIKDVLQKKNHSVKISWYFFHQNEFT